MSGARALPVIVLGSLNMDIIMQVPALPGPGDTILATSVAMESGGKGANQAVAARRMGASVTMLGAVGRDGNGTLLHETLAREGIDMSGVDSVPDLPTGTAAIAIDPAGENQILVAGGANGRPDAAFAARADEGPAIRLVQLETPLAAVETFLRGGAPGTIRILNAASFIAAAAPLLPLCDILIVNEGELAGFARMAPDDMFEGAIVAGARRLITRPGQVVIVTLGAQGALAITPDKTIPVAPVPAVVVDTTGAGDCFCGTLASALAEARPIEEALRLAAHAAAFCVAHPAAIPAMPRMDQLAQR